MQEKSHDYYPYFDWLRGVLALTVVLTHQKLITGWEHSGSFAVQVFFALSGWLIGRILLRTSCSDLPRFFFNRTLRIWVPYYVALAIVLFVSVIRDPITAKWSEIVAYKLTFVYNIFGVQYLAGYRDSMPLRGTANHFWSVNAEEQFYLAAPLLLVMITSRIGRSVALWLALAIGAWWTNLYSSIVMGVFAAVVVSHYGPIHLTRAARAVLSVVVGASFVGFASGWDYYRIAPLCSIAIVLLLAIRGQRHRIGSLVGAVSYPMYLNHWIGGYIVHSAFKRAGLLSSYPVMYHITALSLGVAISVFLYWIVDRRLMARRDRLYTRKLGLVATATAYGLTGAGIAFGLWMHFRS